MAAKPRPQADGLDRDRRGPATHLEEAQIPGPNRLDVRVDAIESAGVEDLIAGTEPGPIGCTATFDLIHANRPGGLAHDGHLR